VPTINNAERTKKVNNGRKLCYICGGKHGGKKFELGTYNLMMPEFHREELPLPISGQGGANL
jgi:hypothetical protein